MFRRFEAMLYSVDDYLIKYLNLAVTRKVVAPNLPTSLHFLTRAGRDRKKGKWSDLRVVGGLARLHSSLTQFNTGLCLRWFPYQLPFSSPQLTVNSLEIILPPGALGLGQNLLISWKSIQS